MGVELLTDRCAAVNPTFDSGIFFTVRCVFILGAAAVGGPEAPVISASDSLTTEESGENSMSSSAGWCSSAGVAISLPGSPLGRGARDQNSKTLACRRSELHHNPTGAVGKTEKSRGNNSEMKKTTRIGQENLRRLSTASGRGLSDSPCPRSAPS